MNFEIILATNNKHKLQEFREILSPLGMTIYCPKDLNLDIPEVEENGTTYYENALIKAKAVASVTTMPVMADDSGIEIEALENKPGIHSARFAESFGGHDKAIQYILENVKDNRKAHFICEIVLLNTTKNPLRFIGIADGTIALEVQGEGGFGYDPIFISDETGRTFASMTEEEKNKASHRGKALKKLITYLRLNNFIR